MTIPRAQINYAFDTMREFLIELFDGDEDLMREALEDDNFSIALNECIMGLGVSPEMMMLPAQLFLQHKENKEEMIRDEQRGGNETRGDYKDE